MKRGEMINRGAAAAITVVFMALVRPDPDPALWETALVSIGMYEALRWCIWYIRRIRRQEKIRKNREVMYYDGTRWADEWITWPLKEVS